MKVSDMYFEEIFQPIKALWKEEYFLEYGNKGKTYIASLGDDFDEVSYIVDIEYKENYTVWHKMMVLVMYQVLTENGLKLLGQAIYSMSVNNIPIEDFEKKYKENLEYEGNEKYLSEYRGGIN